VTWNEKDCFLEQFLPFYENMLEKKQSDEFYYFPAAYYQNLLAGETALCSLCWKEKEAVAGGVFLRGPDLLEYHLGASSELGQELGAMSLLLHQAAGLGQRIGCRYLHLGGGTDSDPDNSLFFFKSGFSNRRGRFRTGNYIHVPHDYAQLKADWETRCGRPAPRVLFYRF